MALIMNASCVPQSFTVFGHHFVLKPGQIKNFNDNIAQFISSERADLGLVPLPDEFTDPEFKDTDEGKRILSEKKADGVKARVFRLKQLAYNETVALKLDLEARNMKTDPRVFMSESALKQLEELASYMDEEDTQKAEQIEKIKRVEKRIGKIEKE